MEQLDPDYPNLAATIRIAEKNRDAAAPWYIRYGIVIIPLAAVLIITVGLLAYLRKMKT